MNKFFDNGSIVYRAEVSRPPYPLDHFHLMIASQFRGAKNPDERHAVFDITLSRDDLTRFHDVIGVHLATFGAPEIEGAPV